MEKILSISVAAYNVEKYLQKALESCVIEEILDYLDIIIVNDGSEDNTIMIAKSFVQKWPDSFTIIDKENGGFGSTVNASLEVAKGKYFRLLDGDDWFDQKGLTHAVNILKMASEDLVISKFKRVFEEGRYEEERNVAEGLNFSIGIFEQVNNNDWFTNAACIYKTEILRECNLRLTEHCFYTDQEYDLYPITKVNSIRVLPYVIYCYRMGHIGQSVSISGLERHYIDQFIVLKRLYKDFPRNCSTAKGRYIFNYIVKRTRMHLRVALTVSITKEHKKELIDEINYLRTNRKDIYDEILNKSQLKYRIMFKILVRTNYIFYRLLHIVSRVTFKNI